MFEAKYHMCFPRYQNVFDKKNKTHIHANTCTHTLELMLLVGLA